MPDDLFGLSKTSTVRGTRLVVTPGFALYVYSSDHVPCYVMPATDSRECINALHITCA